jgi:hypothetical protein
VVVDHVEDPDLLVGHQTNLGRIDLPQVVGNLSHSSKAVQFRRRHFKPAVRRAGLPFDLRFHDLRHTLACLADRPGVAAVRRNAAPGPSLDQDDIRPLRTQVPEPRWGPSSRPERHLSSVADGTNVGRAGPGRDYGLAECCLTWSFEVERIGIEPTTSCLQSKSGEYRSPGTSCSSAR